MARTVEHVARVRAPAAVVWTHVTEVDIAAIPKTWWMTVLGVPHPLRAEIASAGVGGCRTAHFAGGYRFTQEITAWSPPEEYAFTFRADEGFRVGHVLDLATGPFRMLSGRYLISTLDGHVLLTLTSRYALHGLAGRLLRLPVYLTMCAFQRYLLRGIRLTAEAAHAKRDVQH